LVLQMADIEDLKKGLCKEFGDGAALDGKVMQECTRFYSNRFLLTSSSIGITLCQMYNMTPKDLLWKWEAIKFGRQSPLSEVSVFDMDCIVAVKAQITRDLLTRRKQQPRINQSSVISANLNRSLYSTGSVKTTPVQVKTEVNDVSGSAGLSYRGPKLDEASRKKRACKHSLFCFPRW
jgi:DNA polymerase alpha subunit B